MDQLGSQSVNVDSLTPGDLDQLSEVIAQALQVVDRTEGVQGREVMDEEGQEMKREPGDGEQRWRSTGGSNIPKGR